MEKLPYTGIREFGDVRGKQGTVVCRKGVRQRKASLDFAGRIILRLGYDLFDEIDHLLRRGQPVENAQDSDYRIAHLHAASMDSWSRHPAGRNTSFPSWI